MIKLMLDKRLRKSFNEKIERHRNQEDVEMLMEMHLAELFEKGQITFEKITCMPNS